IRIAERRFCLIWSHHHVVLDGWSIATVWTEVLRYYNANRNGTPLQLPKSKPYVEYIQWLQHQDQKSSEDFWRDLLKDANPTPVGIERVGRHPRIAKREFSRKIHRINSQTTSSFAQFAHRHGLTLNSLVQGTWAMLLSRYSGQHDIVFGITNSGRPDDQPGAEDAVGLFINTVPVRLQIDPDESILDCLAASQKRQAEAWPHQFCPLVRIQACSSVPPGEAIFEHILVFENYPVSQALRSETGEIRVARAWSNEMTNYALTVLVIPEKEMEFQLLYDCQLFEAEMIEQLMRHWERLLVETVNDPFQKVSQVHLLNEAERQQ